MGENKNNQMFGQTKTNQQNDYGSQQHGRHNHDGTSPFSIDDNEKDRREASLGSPDSFNLQNQDTRFSEDNLPESSPKDDFYEQGTFTHLSQMYETEDENWVARVEGDDKDILGDTENSQRNQQRMREWESNQGGSQNR